MARPKKLPESEIDAMAVFEARIKQINKDMGGDVVVKGIGDVIDPEPNYSGSTALDAMLHIPFAEGAMHEVYGPAGTGKSTIVLTVGGKAQQAGKYVLYANMEGSLNRSLVDSISCINPDAEDEFGNKTFRLLEADTGEAALAAVHAFAQIPNSVIIVDSVDSLVPEAVVGAGLDKQHMAKLAKLMSAACRDLKDILRKARSTIIFVNQIRKNPGVMFGNPNVQPGGEALPFYAVQRLELQAVPAKNKIIDSNGKMIGQIVPFFVKKNKCTAPFVKGEVPIYFGRGIWESYDVISVAVQIGLIQEGAKGRIIPPASFHSMQPTFTCDGETQVHKSQVLDWMDEHPKSIRLLESEIRQLLYGLSPQESRRDVD
jgi:recombination protein RecA